MRINWPDWIKGDIDRMVSVDVETAGPNPADYALLSIGACTFGSPRRDFYVELQPTTMNSEPGSDEVHQLDLEQLSRTGVRPEDAMCQFEDWVNEAVQSDQPPLFLGFNAPFDWMFVCDYFHRFSGHNPFGHSAVDIKSFLMGFSHLNWQSTSMAHLTSKQLRHNAMQDACDQADLFRRLVTRSE